LTVFTLFIVVALILITIYVFIYLNARQYILRGKITGHYSNCLVLGAGLEKDSLPTDILTDRVCAAAKLYKNGQVDQLIMSGARRDAYDEPGAMRTAALALGLPKSAILLDFEGISTLDSCLNFKDTYGSELVIVTQAFHLPRAVFLARKLGLPAYGIAAHIYRFSWDKQAYWQTREILAMPYNLVKLFVYLVK
jgi:SanA protein